MIRRTDRNSLLLLTIILPFLGTNAQSIAFKRYSNADYRFSFDIPNYWKIVDSKVEGGLVCVPVTASEREEYKDCYEGIVFRMNIFRTGLDSALDAEGIYTKDGDTYITRDRTGDSVRAKNISGTTWRGIYHNNVCEINCESIGVHALGGHCEFLYFSNGSMTVCIDTDGRAFDEAILKRLLASFRIYK